MVFSRARPERNVEDRSGIACWKLMGLMLKLIASDREKTQYCADISWGGPISKRA